jgi:hypothetical protein
VASAAPVTVSAAARGSGLALASAAVPASAVELVSVAERAEGPVPPVPAWEAALVWEVAPVREWAVLVVRHR